MIDSRAKGARGELKIRDILRELTKLPWERTPGSGAFSASHHLKGDLYVPGYTNKFTVEVKSYEEDHLNSGILVNKTAMLPQWWSQAVRQSEQNNNQPLLIFKHNRSKNFVAFITPKDNLATYNNLTINLNGSKFYISLLEDYIANENPKFI
jgi:hypothetical protein